MDNEANWVLDSLVGFLQGPLWNIPILTFIEQKSIVFDPDDDNNDAYNEDKHNDNNDENYSNEEHEDEYKKIFEEYKNLVDTLLASHMDDLQISYEQFEKACTQVRGNFLHNLGNNLFETIGAANDYNLFKEMMIQSNLNYQIQALAILIEKYGTVPESLIPFGSCKEDFLDRSMDDMIKDELNSEFEDNKDDVLKVAIEEKRRLEMIKEREKANLDEALSNMINDKCKLNDQCENLKDTNNTRIKEDANIKPSIEDTKIKERQEYLRKQRDKIIEIKRKQRKKQICKMENSHIMAERPKSAKLIKSLIDENNDNKLNEEDRTKGIAFRKSLVETIKREVLNRDQEKSM